MKQKTDGGEKAYEFLLYTSLRESSKAMGK